MITYPDKHAEIVKALFSDGRFLIEGDAAFHSLRENQVFYLQFFKETFRLDLTLTAEYALLKSSKDVDDLARSICIFLAVMCYELDQDNGNLLEMLAFNTFSIEEWEDRFEQSSFHNVFEATDKLRNKGQRKKFYQQIARRKLINLLEGDRFQFTAAHRYFLAYARDLNMREMLANDMLKQDT